MRRVQLVLILTSVLGLALYLWSALAAPVVLCSDSQIDMDWARNGIGISRPVLSPAPGEPLVHPPKVGYLVFLAAAMGAGARAGVLTLGVWMFTRSAAGPDPLRGVGHPILEPSRSRTG